MTGENIETEKSMHGTFFERVREFKDIQRGQKSRGLNDYNIITSLLKVSDEVRLHSRFLSSLLKPDGDHYQGGLFLEKFIEVIGLNDFNLDIRQATVHVEYKNIDLYITDGNKHIIIENKIWAKDQKHQIIGYINKMVDADSDSATRIDDLSRIDNDYIRVVYLTARNDKLVPEGHVVVKECITADGELDKKLKNYRARYHRISYEEEILRWLDIVQFEVSNLSNLNLAIEQYREVILRLYRKYKVKVMTFEKYLFDTDADETDTIRLALTLEKDLVTIKGRVLYEFFNKLSAVEIGGRKGELYSLYEEVFGRSLCQNWVRRKKNGPRDFGVRWVIDSEDYVAVHAGITHLHVGIRSKDALGDNCTDRKLFGHELKKRSWSYPFSSYDLGKYDSIDLEIKLGESDKNIVSALENLFQCLRSGTHP